MTVTSVSWLLDSDPTIIFQAKRDLLYLPENEWKSDQERISTSGWGARLLALQDPDGKWGSGLYGPKFISTHYTLLLLRRFEMLPNEKTSKGCDRLIEFEHIGATEPSNPRQDDCITGMGLGILAHFKSHSEIFDRIMESIEKRQLKDGGWNCRVLRNKTTHSSLHTTLSVLEGLLFLKKNYPNYKTQVDELSERGIEFLLIHELFKSHKTKKIIHPNFTEIGFPPRWKYNILSALDYLRAARVPYDERMQDAIDIVQSHSQDGYWKKGKQMSGKTFFNLEQPRKPSEFNTLRALRVLKTYS